MFLYHFTARNRLSKILRNGLALGDVPVDGQLGPGLNAVWLTTDLKAEGHGLGEAREMTDAERQLVYQWKGILPAPGYRFDNKREVRIKVNIPRSDTKLKLWLPWARKRLDPAWLDQLNQSGGGKVKARTWWLYFGVIPSTNFAEIIDVETGQPLSEVTGA